MPDEVQATNHPTPLNALLDTPRPADSVVAWRIDKTEIKAITWQAFHSRTCALAAALHNREEMRWSLVCNDGFEFAIGLFALAQAGKSIVLPQNPQQKVDNCATLLSDTVAYSPTLRTNENHPIDNIALPRNFEQATLSLYTSGSSGKQKCISKTWQQINEEIRTLEATFGQALIEAPTGTAILGTVPHYHIYGLLFRILWPLVSARPFISQPCLLADEIISIISQLPHVALISSPAHLKRLPSVSWPDAIRKKLAIVFSSGSPLGMETANDLQHTCGQTPIEIYGSTETGGIAWRQQVKNDTWQALPGVSIHIEADKLAVRSMWTENQAWTDTGDCAQAIGKDNFLLKGRSDGVVKIEDKRLSLLALETLLLEHPFIESAKLLVLTQARQTIAAACVLNNEGKDLLQQRGKRELQGIFRDHLAQRYELITLPRRWRFVNILPTNEMGKHDWQSLAALFNKNGSIQRVNKTNQ